MALRRTLLWIVPVSLLLGALLSLLQGGNWVSGWPAFSTLFLLSFLFLTLSVQWAGPGRALAWMAALAFGLRLAGGVGTYLLLPVNGYPEPDDRAGFVFTDAHRRDSQAWDLAVSDRPLTAAFSERYAYDQYGGLLALSALVYRYLSPDMHRPLLLVLLSALAGALGLPFLWRAASRVWGDRTAAASGWIFALYPEAVLLAGSAMREPYLMLFSALALWGFVHWRREGNRRGWGWIAAGLAGMLLVSPAVALVTLVLLGGWLYFSSERGSIPWWLAAAGALIFIAGLLLLSSALDRQGNLSALTPFGVVNNWLRAAVKWDMYQLERGSGWVQKLFDEMPAWLHLPFVVVYGIFQPVLPATFVEPTTATWRVIGVTRALGWYALLPVLVLSLFAARDPGFGRPDRAEGEASGERGEVQGTWLWLSILIWAWILLAALRGGGDQWDNPRYRAILFVWQALLAGRVLTWWAEKRSAWFLRLVLAEIVFLAVFSQWYASRYYQWGGQLPFAGMIALILGAWALIAALGWLRDRRRSA
ncbi:MAG: ArnT family glycosyltransferase [Bacteroidota bacterium]